MAMAKWIANNKLKEWRESKGHSQADMAKLFELHSGEQTGQSTYNYWESGRNPMSPNTVLMLSIITGMDHKEFAVNVNEAKE